MDSTGYKMLADAGMVIGAAAVAALGHGVQARSSQLFGPSVWRGPRDRKQIALTFDDGPSEETPRLLDLLDALSVRATFFQCGQNVKGLPAISRAVREGGHELGNHSYSHPRLLACSAARIREEISQTQRSIEDAAGIQPRWFRAPYGTRWFGLRAALRAHGLTGVMWTVMGYDWKWEADKIADHVARHAESGAIICLHDGDRTSARVDRRNTVRAVGQVITRLCRQGYSFVTVGKMFGH